MSLPLLKEFIDSNFVSQAAAARSLHISVQQFNRLVNGATPIGWGFVGRAWYFWHYKNFLPDVENVIAIIADSVFHTNGEAE